jgi:hypothetical protein
VRICATSNAAVRSRLAERQLPLLDAGCDVLCSIGVATSVRAHQRGLNRCVHQDPAVDHPAIARVAGEIAHRRASSMLAVSLGWAEARLKGGGERPGAACSQRQSFQRRGLCEVIVTASVVVARMWKLTW